MSNSIHKSIFGQRLKQLMKNFNETTYSLSEQFNLSPPSISRYTRGEMAPKMTTVYALADYFDVNPEWLMGKTVSMYESEILGDTPAAGHAFDISVFDEIRYDRPIFSNHKAADHLSIPIDKLTEWGPVFGYRIPDDAMQPAYTAGDLVVIRLNTGLTSGATVALHVNKEPMIIRKIILMGNKLITQPFNADADAAVYDIRKHHVQMIGTIVYRRHVEEAYFPY
ncbi:S24 family peptidase [Pseudoramibacter sp. HA2172]|uniref:S24 family peptidase n=1 Tax=Pseudoramibacter faecis TaxID=3108534 RepID=UPI002E769F08|nr:S24 family peptidase [Pseudoramibacter sp. HA2172]